MSQKKGLSDMYSKSVAELIQDVISYDPSKLNNAQLADDMRICFAWYSTIKQGKKFKLSEQDVIALAQRIYNEIEKRKRAGKMKHDWKPDGMKNYSKELFEIISNQKENENLSLQKKASQISPVTKGNEEVNGEVFDGKDQGCGKAWEVLFAEGMAVQYFEDKDDAIYFADSVNKCSTDTGFAKDVIHVKHSFVHRHSRTKRCYPVNKKGLKFKCSRKELEIDPEIKNWFHNNLPIYPGGTSDEYEPLELSDFLGKWSSFAIRKPFISLVGSLANWERTEGDIDILVKAHDPSPLLDALDRAIVKCFEMKEEQMADLLILVHQFIHTDSLFLNTQWRIERAFPEWKNRIQILDDSFSGPFTNFVELADLIAVAREEKKREEMSEKKLKLFDWFPMLKPLHGRKKGEIYSIDSVIETIKSRKEDWFSTGIYVEKKFDGVHTQCHKRGERVKLITEDGTDITKNSPSLVKELLDIDGDFILCGEIELWKDGKHQSRADTAGVLNSKEAHPDEKFLRFNVFDCLYKTK